MAEAASSSPVLFPVSNFNSHPENSSCTVQVLLKSCIRMNCGISELLQAADTVCWLLWLSNGNKCKCCTLCQSNSCDLLPCGKRRSPPEMRQTAEVPAIFVRSISLKVSTHCLVKSRISATDFQIFYHPWLAAEVSVSSEVKWYCKRRITLRRCSQQLRCPSDTSQNKVHQH